MAENSAIEWTTHTFNPWVGCTKISPGCANCYAEDRNTRFKKGWGDNSPREVKAEAGWREPFKWNREAGRLFELWGLNRDSDTGPPPRPRVFCASLADVFEDHPGQLVDHYGRKMWQTNTRFVWMAGDGDKKPNPECVPLTQQFVRERLFETIANTPNLDWLLLTKRPENWREVVTATVEGASQDNYGCGDLMCAKWLKGEPPSNVWIGATVENQEQTRRMIDLARIPARCRFLSCEPLLSAVNLALTEIVPVDLFRWKVGRTMQEFIHWVIIGGESGRNARPCQLDWIRDLVAQCKPAGVAPFVKQLGDMAGDAFNGSGLVKLELKTKKGGNWNEWPEDLRIREFPTVGG